MSAAALVLAGATVELCWMARALGGARVLLEQLHSPLAEEEDKRLCAALGAKQLFIYCGHGDGSRYVGADELQRLPRCAVSLLMGCSSGALTRHGGLAPSGIALSYLHARCPALIGNLWDVTDGEIDRLCDALLSECIKGGCLLAAVARAREACRLPYLTGAAAVCYGVPLRILPRGSTTA